MKNSWYSKGKNMEKICLGHLNIVYLPTGVSFYTFASWDYNTKVTMQWGLNYVIADSCVYDHHAFTKFFRIGKYSSCLDREDVVCFLFCCLYTLRFLHVDKIKKNPLQPAMYCDAKKQVGPRSIKRRCNLLRRGWDFFCQTITQNDNHSAYILCHMKT